MPVFWKGKIMNNTFDIYNFINSSAIANHCREIKYQFSTADMAYLIWASEKYSLEEKHNAYRSLIETQPDAEIAERPWTPHIKSLHSFLQHFIELESKYTALFLENEPSCIYSYSIRYPGGMDYTQDKCVFPTFEMCLGAIKEDISNVTKTSSDDLRYIQVKKQWINHSKNEEPKYMVVFIDSEGNPWNIFDSYKLISKEDSETLDAFRGMWPEIPTPFKSGDILTYKNKFYDSNEPFVLESILYWKDAVREKVLNHLRERGDESDLSSNIYCIADNGTICLDHGPNYLDMEYYRGNSERTKFDVSKRALYILSALIKDSGINAGDGFVGTFNKQMLNGEEDLKKLFSHEEFHYDDEPLKGPFWLVTEDDEEYLIAYPVEELASTPSHKITWNKCKGEINKEWNYYPRGRVHIKGNAAIVYANPLCFESVDLEKMLKEKFNLWGMRFEYKADASAHYTEGVFGEYSYTKANNKRSH